MFAASLLAVGTLTCLPVFAREKEKEPAALQPRDKWAVLIGVDATSDPAFGSMRTAKSNISGLHTVLHDPEIGRFAPGHIVTLLDAKATTDAIRAAVVEQWLVHKALPSDLIVLYFCGRVLPSVDHSDAVFCSYDISESSPTSSGVPLKRLISELKMRTQSKNIICLLDTSPASDATMQREAASSELTKVQHFAQDCQVAVLSANQMFHDSKQSDASGMSRFCSTLIDGIQSGGGQMSLNAVGDYVMQTVKDANQTAIYLPSPDNSQLNLTAFGCTTKVAASTPHVKFGHPIDTLALDRPDLLAAKTPIVDKSPHAQTQQHQDNDEQKKNYKPDFQPYMAKLRKDIEAKWAPPKGFEDHRVVAVFSISREGKIYDPEIVESDGIDSVDVAAMEALKGVVLDPLPPGAPESVRIKFKFDWHMTHQ
ncbi:MAG TPA: TonB C-terminal domain-containing protein [Planktothrix sp.]